MKRYSPYKRHQFILIITTLVVMVLLLPLGDMGSGDRESYIRAWHNLSNGIIDMERTPVYPYLIGLAMKVGGAHWEKLLFALQNVTACIAVWYVYKLAGRILLSERAAFWTAMAVAIISDFICWRNCVMTESLAMSGSVFLVYNAINIYDAKSRWNLAGFAFWLLFLIFLRPAFTYMLPVFTVAFVLMIIKKRKLWKRAAAGIAAILVATALMLSYAQAFYKTYGIFATTAIALENEFYDMRQAGTLDPAKAEDKALGAFIARTYRDNGVKLYDYSYCPILWHDIDYAISHWSLPAMQQIVKASRTPQNVIKGITVRAYYAGKDILIYPRKSDPFGQLNITVGWIYLLLVLYAVWLCSVWHAEKRLPWIQLLLFMLGASNVIIAVIGAFGQNVAEWGRLIYPSKFIYLIMLMELLLTMKGRIVSTSKNSRQ